MIIKLVKCNCGKTVFELTDIQYSDFACGIMGILRCPKCDKIVLPEDPVKNKIEITEKEMPGIDPGWS